MINRRIIEDYLQSHAIVSKLEKKDAALLRRILMIFEKYHDSEFLERVDILMACCNTGLIGSYFPDTAIAKVATKALEMLLKDFDRQIFLNYGKG